MPKNQSQNTQKNTNFSSHKIKYRQKSVEKGKKLKKTKISRKCHRVN